MEIKTLTCECGALVTAYDTWLGNVSDDTHVWAWNCRACGEEYCVDYNNEWLIID